LKYYHKLCVSEQPDSVRIDSERSFVARHATSQDYGSELPCVGFNTPAAHLFANDGTQFRRLRFSAYVAPYAHSRVPSMVVPATINAAHDRRTYMRSQLAKPMLRAIPGIDLTC
jgi:hypothetical protein